MYGYVPKLGHMGILMTSAKGVPRKIQKSDTFMRFLGQKMSIEEIFRYNISSYAIFSPILIHSFYIGFI